MWQCLETFLAVIRGGDWFLVDRDQGCRCVPYNVPSSPSPETTTKPTEPTVPRGRNPGRGLTRPILQPKKYWADLFLLLYAETNYEARVNSDTSLIFITWDMALLFTEIQELCISKKEGSRQGNVRIPHFPQWGPSDILQETVQWLELESGGPNLSQERPSHSPSKESHHTVVPGLKPICYCSTGSSVIVFQTQLLKEKGWTGRTEKGGMKISVY